VGLWPEQPGGRRQLRHRAQHGAGVSAPRPEGWPLLAALPEGLSDAELEKRLFAPVARPPGQPRPLPEWPTVHQELRRKGMTLFLLWQEYKAVHPEGYQYSQFCERYRQWAGTLEVCLRQEHTAGQKMFVDWAGQTAAVVDPATGQTRQAQIFVAVLGASNYTYVEAAWTQGLADWIAAHIHSLRGCGASWPSPAAMGVT